jgi:hypothetical protein
MACMHYAMAQIEKLQASLEGYTIEFSEGNGRLTNWYYLPLRQQYVAELRRLPDSVLIRQTIHTDLHAFYIE